MRLTAIGVHRDAWTTVEEVDQEYYRVTARIRGVEIDVRDDATPRGNTLLELRVLDDGSEKMDRTTYHGAIRCPRPLWEHRLRQLFDLYDPCFPAASG